MKENAKSVDQNFMGEPHEALLKDSQPLYAIAVKSRENINKACPEPNRL